MALVPPVTPMDVEQVGALRYELFNLPDQPTMLAFLQGAIDYADAWMQGHMGANYGLSQYTWQVDLQRRGQIYLALEAVCDTLKAEKIYGTHFAYMSEESASYEALIDNEWGQRAKEALDLWITVEQQGKPGFAMPYFGITEPVPILEDCSNGLESLKVLYEQLLAHSRGRVNPAIGTAFT
jgi:hypothetical protein